MFDHEHHQKIAQALSLFNGDLLREQHCYFGGGTAIALTYGEYRESVDIDFLVSDLTAYRTLRQLLTTSRGIETIMQPGQQLVRQIREIRADQYGIRTVLSVAESPIKFEIVREARIALDTPDDTQTICHVTTLTPIDMAASKLLANADRWADAGVFNRDVIDLAMMQPSPKILMKAIEKAQSAYGDAICRDLHNAIDHLQQKTGWLERCMQAMSMHTPKALLWQHLNLLKKYCKV